MTESSLLKAESKEEDNKTKQNKRDDEYDRTTIWKG